MQILSRGKEKRICTGSCRYVVDILYTECSYTYIYDYFIYSLYIYIYSYVCKNEAYVYAYYMHDQRSLK